MSKKVLTGIIIAVLAIMGCGAAASVAVWKHTWQGRILPGVRVAGVNLGGLTAQDAAAKVDRLQLEFLTAPVSITLEGHNWQANRRQLGFTVNSRAIVDQALHLGRQEIIWDQFGVWWRASHQGSVLPLDVRIDFSKAQALLSGFIKGVYDSPKEARLVVNDSDQVLITPGSPGKAVDCKATLRQLSDVREPFARTIPLVVQEQQPQVTTAELQEMRITGLLAAYTTNFAVANVNRTYNINIAADALDNVLIKPGTVFSFNQVVGPRSKESGYKEALVIVQDQFTPGIGGGVCQVSSTLYNVALLSGLKIVERSNHSLPVTYVPLGRDATVSYGGTDLKISNNTSGYLYIRSRVSGGSLTFKIFGNKAEKKRVSLDTVVDQTLESKTVTKDDPNLYVGKIVVEHEGLTGYRVRAYRTFHTTAGDQRQLVSHDLYKPLDKLVRVGKMPLPVSPVPLPLPVTPKPVPVPVPVPVPIPTPIPESVQTPVIPSTPPTT